MTLSASTLSGTSLSDEPERAQLALTLTVGVSMGFAWQRVVVGAYTALTSVRRVEYSGGRSGVQFDGQAGRVIE